MRFKFRSKILYDKRQLGQSSRGFSHTQIDAQIKGSSFCGAQQVFEEQGGLSCSKACTVNGVNVWAGVCVLWWLNQTERLQALNQVNASGERSG